uniref:CHCH domain-containing protein n=1 Tax=Strigamia maritima TaxID=126957 RepID=T1INE3_STRMM
MGGSNSTRRITVVNDESTGVIKISDSVVNRLREPFATMPQPPPQLPLPTPSRAALPKPTVRSEDSSTKMREDEPHAKGLREHYWREKFRELEKRHAGILKQTTDEFNRGLQTVEELFSNPTVTGICEEVEAKVYECYKTNPHSSLDCARQVQAFTDCVQAFRLRTLVAKG